MSPEEFMKEYELANRAHDLARVRSLIAEDALFWFSNGSAYPGIEKIAEAINHNFTTIADEHYEIGPIRWLVRAESCAVCSYPFRWTGKIGRQPAPGSSRGTSAPEKRHGPPLLCH